MFGLDSLAPKFIVPSKRIKILNDPSEFYVHLCSKIKSAKSRVFLASLYLGNRETELVDIMSEALRKNEKLRVYILLDALRGTREAPQTCSASLLAPLASEFPNRVQLSFYKTPKLGRILSKVLPRRIVEVVGLQHMKLYGCDDEIVLSGANLSRDYFTNRQDRYISINDSNLCNWFFKLHQGVADLSYKLKPASSLNGFELAVASKRDSVLALNRIKTLIEPSTAVNGSSPDKSRITAVDENADETEDTTDVYPVCQFTPLKIGNELKAMQIITEEAKSKFNWMLTAGYFNMEPVLAEKLCKSSTKGEVIIAAPEANGFYQSKGLSGKIPTFYSMIAYNFLTKLPRNGNVVMREWQRGIVNQPGGWSYHAKGVWISPTLGSNDSRSNNFPFLTYIGSSNFTRRSYLHDLECGALLVAHGSNNSLRKQLQSEKENLQQHCGPAVTLKNFKKPDGCFSTWRNWLILRIFGDRL